MVLHAWQAQIGFTDSAAPAGALPLGAADPGLTPGATFGPSLRDSEKAPGTQKKRLSEKAAGTQKKPSQKRRLELTKSPLRKGGWNSQKAPLRKGGWNSEKALSEKAAGTQKKPSQKRRLELTKSPLRKGGWNSEKAPLRKGASQKRRLKGAHYYSRNLRDYTSVASRKPSSWRMRVGWRILRRALASIWRMRSRVTLNWRPTSSRVRL